MLNKIRARKRLSPRILIRELALQYALREAARGVHEVGGNNRGPDVRKYLKIVGLGEGYAWCDAFVSWCLHRAAGRKVDVESASVGLSYSRARTLGWAAKRPFRADIACFDFNGDGRFDDHTGFVVKVLSIKGLCWYLKTCEGNTSSGRAGSQADGDGVFVKRRLIRKSRVGFIRVPGRVPRPTAAL